MNTWTPDELKENIESGHKIFLKLFKKGCGACKLSEPATDRLASSNEHGLLFAKIDVEEYPELLEASNSEVLPAFFVFNDKKRLGSLIGFKGLRKLQEFVDECFAVKS